MEMETATWLSGPNETGIIVSNEQFYVTKLVSEKKKKKKKKFRVTKLVRMGNLGFFFCVNLTSKSLSTFCPIKISKQSKI